MTAFSLKQKSLNLFPKISMFYDVSSLHYHQRLLPLLDFLGSKFLESFAGVEISSVGSSLEIFIFSIKYLNKR